MSRADRTSLSVPSCRGLVWGKISTQKDCETTILLDTLTNILRKMRAIVPEHGFKSFERKETDGFEVQTSLFVIGNMVYTYSYVFRLVRIDNVASLSAILGCR